MRGPAQKIKKKYQQFAGFIIDIEGVLIKGETVIPGAAQTISALKQLKKKLIYLSNISDQTRAEVCEKLKKHGFPIDPTGILTSAYAAVLYLQENYPHIKNVFLVGTPSFERELTANGFRVVKHHNLAQAVLVGLDYELNYWKIGEAARAIKNGSLFIASNQAKIKLTEKDYNIGPGFTVKGLEYVTGKDALLVGKPAEFMFHLALNKMDLAPHRVLTIGDKLEQDIYGGHAVGTATCLVLSGVTTRQDPLIASEKYKLDFIIESISQLLEKK